MPKVKLRKETVDRLAFDAALADHRKHLLGQGKFAPHEIDDKISKTRQVDYFDTEIKGFGVRISREAKTYFVMKRVNGKLTRVNIGKHGPWTAENARKEAQALLVKMDRGQDPNSEKKAAKDRGVALQEVLDEYLKVNKKLKSKTATLYRSWIEGYFPDWLKRPVAEITADMVTRRHMKIGEDHGPAMANGVMRVLRALMNYIKETYPKLLSQNPVQLKRKWYPVERRKTYVKPHEFPAWFKAVQELDNPTFRDYFVLLLFTGLRREEAASLRWEDVDFMGRTLTVKDTKNKEPLTLPLTDYVQNLLKRRMESYRENDYVFPGTGKKGYIQEPKKAAAKTGVASGVKFSCHDLRRSFITLAESLDISAYALKRLVNHKMSGDVTAGYIIHDPERLRAPMQKITDAILRAAEERHEPARVIAFRR